MLSFSITQRHNLAYGTVTKSTTEEKVNSRVY